MLIGYKSIPTKRIIWGHIIYLMDNIGNILCDLAFISHILCNGDYNFQSSSNF